MSVNFSPQKLTVGDLNTNYFYETPVLDLKSAVQNYKRYHCNILKLQMSVKVVKYKLLLKMKNILPTVTKDSTDI